MITGSCLCGAIRYQLDGPFEEMHHCHCSRCRKVHGAPFATFAQARSGDLRLLSGTDEVRRFSSSADAERSFCGVCGSSLLFALAALPDAIWIAVGSLDSDPGLRPQAHIFVGSKASWHTIEDALPQFVEYPPQQ